MGTALRHGSRTHPAPRRALADAGFLELTRLGIKPASDRVIINSLQVFDAPPPTAFSGIRVIRNCAAQSSTRYPWRWQTATQRSSRSGSIGQRTARPPGREPIGCEKSQPSKSLTTILLDLTPIRRCADTPLQCNRGGQARIRDPEGIDILYRVRPDLQAEFVNQLGDRSGFGRSQSATLQEPTFVLFNLR